jgi:WD40 repeat protein
MSYVAHDCDVNCISWNTHTPNLLASGDDKGEFRIWDLRMLGSNASAHAQAGKKDAGSYESITKIRWHTKYITSL